VAGPVLDKGRSDPDDNLVGGRQSAENGPGRDIGDAEPRQDSPGAIVERAPVDQSEDSGRIGPAEKEVLSDAQPRQDVQFLVQETQTETMGVACA
jgi:hypothetical protein